MIHILTSVALIFTLMEVLYARSARPGSVEAWTPLVVFGALLLNMAWAGPAVRHYFWFLVGLLPL